MNIRNKDRKIKNISFEIYQDQEENLNNYFLDILLASKNNIPIPKDSVLKVIDIVSEVWENKDTYSFELVRQVYERFKKYDFNSKLKIDDRIIKMNLNLFIETIIILTIGKEYQSKKECINDLLIVTNNTWENSLNKKSQKLMSNYIRFAIVGYITTKYGFHLFSGVSQKPPTNSQLYQSVRDVVKK